LNRRDIALAFIRHFCDGKVRDLVALMAQWTRFRGLEISGITLVFDPRGFA